MNRNAGAVEIIPAILARNRNELLSLVARVEPFAKTVQLDVVDGIFDNDISWPYTNVGTLEEFSGFRLPHLQKIFWEVDLMTKDPRELGERFVVAGASRVIAHIEAFEHADRAREVFETWHVAGAQAGVSLLLDTPIAAIEDILFDVEVVQIMGIAEIGAQGLPFDERVIVRVRELRERAPQTIIAVDGGINVEHAKELVRAGANRLAVGSAIIKSDDPHAAYRELCAAVE